MPTRMSDTELLEARRVRADLLGLIHPTRIPRSARVVLQPGHKVLRFNYATNYTRPWSTTPLKKKFDCEAYVGDVKGRTATF